MSTSTTLALVLILGAAAQAEPARQTGRQAREAGRPARENAPHVEIGTVIAVDAAGGKLRVRGGDGSTRTFSARAAKVSNAQGKTVSLADLAVGDEVSIAYDIAYNGKNAVEILRLHKSRRR